MSDLTSKTDPHSQPICWDSYPAVENAIRLGEGKATAQGQGVLPYADRGCTAMPFRLSRNRIARAPCRRSLASRR